jgi:hypothetical protein
MRASIGEGEGIVVGGGHAVTHSQFLGVVIGAPARGVHRRGLAASPLRTGHFARNTIAVMTDSASRHDARQHAAKSIVADGSITAANRAFATTPAGGMLCCRPYKALAGGSGMVEQCGYMRLPANIRVSI